MSFTETLITDAPEFTIQHETPGGVLIRQNDAKHAVALLLDGRHQYPDKAEIHSCTLESGDHVYSFSHIGSRRSQHQDRLLVYPDRSLVLVADGYQSLGAEVAEDLAIVALKSGPELRDITAKAQNKIFEKYDSKRYSETGTVFVLAKICSDEANGKHLEYDYRGDTAIVRIPKSSEEIFRTEDHSIEEEYRKMNIPVPYCLRNIITNALSLDSREAYKDVEGRLRLAVGDRIIIGCDGVLKNVPAEEIAAASKAMSSSREFTEWLFKLGFEGKDNISAAVIDIV